MPVFKHEVAREGDLRDGELKEFKFGEYSVLLSFLNGKYHATSPRCTHYGAPLEKGVLAKDGRITCPWHGACFNSATGDIEDAPALDSLCIYEVSVEDGKIYVKADEEQLKVGRRKPRLSLAKQIKPDTCTVILGGGASGSACAQKLREEGYAGRVIVVSRETYFPIDRPMLSKALHSGEADKIALRGNAFYSEMNVEFILGTDATRVDPLQKFVTLADGRKLNYDYLVIGTGGWPRVPPISGSDLSNVFTLRTFQNNISITQALEAKQKPKVVVVGSSFIGMELASAIVSKGAEVTVVGMGKVPFDRVLGEKIGRALQKLHESKGVSFRMGSGVSHIQSDSNDASRAGGVVLQSGEVLPADLVILGTGVAPQTSYLRDSPGFQLEKDGGLRVNAHLRVPGVENVYAVGDVAHFPLRRLTDESIRIEHWNVGLNMGRLAALNIVHGDSQEFTHIPYFWTAQHGKSLRYCGFASHFDDVIIQGDLDGLAFVAFYVLGEKVLAVASLQKDPVVSYCTELIRLGKMPTASEIRAGKDVMSIPLNV
ncbi:uncharacterized protein VTP21DRAFT_10668 [Calcarisporiella thermophila]|uniref:uncharacterized protein n=1 Tax=Calcarisporiella thermophila TaxID=911321 RepID=UPI0037433A3E